MKPKSDYQPLILNNTSYIPKNIAIVLLKLKKDYKSIRRSECKAKQELYHVESNKNGGSVVNIGMYWHKEFTLT